MHYSAERLDLFAWCVRISRLLVGFRMHFKSLHLHSFIHASIVYFHCLHVCLLRVTLNINHQSIKPHVFFREEAQLLQR